VINGLARHDLCQIERWEGRTAAEVDKEVARIDAWAAANAGKSAVEIDRELLAAEVAAGTPWARVGRRVRGLLEANDPAAYDALRAYLAKEANAYSKAEILRLYLGHDVSRAKDLAPPHLADTDPSVRFAAALIVFRTGDKAKARPVLGDGLASSHLHGLHADAIEELLKEGSAESRKEAARVFANPQLRDERDGLRPRLLARSAAAGMAEPYRFYLDALGRGGRELKGWNVWAGSAVDAAATEVVKQFAPDDPAVKAIAGKFPKAADQVPELIRWLRSRLEGAKD
jgi:hypothetical protein